VICIMVELTSLPPSHLFLRLNPEWFNFLALDCPGYPGKEAVKCVFIVTRWLDWLPVSVDDDGLLFLRYPKLLLKPRSFKSPSANLDFSTIIEGLMLKAKSTEGK